AGQHLLPPPRSDRRLGAAPRRRAGHLVDPPPGRRHRHAAPTAPKRAGLAADLCTLAQPDRAAVALAAPRRAQGAAPRRRLDAPAPPRQRLPRSVRPWLTCLAPLCRLARGRSLSLRPL